MNRDIVVNGHQADGPGLFEVTHPDDDNRHVTNVRRIAGEERAPGSLLIAWATVLLAALAAGLLAVSLAAQYQYVMRERHQHLPSLIEAGALDVAMILFSLLALGLARNRQQPRTERVLIMVCAAGSAVMNFAASDPTSARSVLAYIAPPVLLAVCTDRVIAVVRRHVLGLQHEGSAWRAVGAALRATAMVALYGLRFILAPKSTSGGVRRWVLQVTPLPAAPGELPSADRQALPPGSCLGDVPGIGNTLARPCGNARPCEIHEPQVRIPGETKKEHLLRVYAMHPDLRNRDRVGRVARELAPHAELSEGTARAYIYSFLNSGAEGKAS